MLERKQNPYKKKKTEVQVVEFTPWGKSFNDHNRVTHRMTSTLGEKRVKGRTCKASTNLSREDMIILQGKVVKFLL